MIEIPIWALVLLCVGCVPTLLLITAFITFILTDGVKNVVDDNQRR